MSEENLPGILAMVSRIEGGPFYTIKQVADEVGRHPDTIKRWGQQNENLRPTHKMDLGESGEAFCWLYTKKDIKNLKAFSKTQVPGRRKSSSR